MRRIHSIDNAWFESLYQRNPDPWNFSTSNYERAKYTATLAALPAARYRRAFEPGCSIGVFTRLLSARCETLLATDVSDTALAVAQQRCKGLPVRLELRRVPDQWPNETFNLIVLSELLYYLARPDLELLASKAQTSLLPASHIVLVHYLGPTDYPLTGDEAATIFLAALNENVVRTIRTANYRIDVVIKQDASEFTSATPRFPPPGQHATENLPIRIT